MVKEIKNHTRELEDKVRERTCDLEEKSTQLEEARDSAEAVSQAKTEILDKVMESIHICPDHPAGHIDPGRAAPAPGPG